MRRKFFDALQTGTVQAREALDLILEVYRVEHETLTSFLDDARIPLDNNASERALRVVALGRKNFLFVGDQECGSNLAGLYSLVATCDAVGVDPVHYLKNVIMCVDTHPASRIDELLPHNRQQPAAGKSD